MAVGAQVEKASPTVDSPVAHMIGTNLAPSGPELLALRAALSQKRQDISRLDVEIGQAAMLLARLLDEKKLACAFVEVHQPLVSPARHMPREIWEEIFLHCLPDDIYVTPSVNMTPLLMGRVCRAWRKVAYSTPRLWSSIAVKVSKDGCQPCIQMVNTWLARSGTSPLSLSLHHDADAGDDALVVLDVLVSFFARWKNIHLVLNGLSYHPLEIKGHPPILESGDIYSSSDSPLPLAIYSAPSLRTFTWSVGSGGSGLRAAQLIPAWPKLTNLCLNCNLSPNEALETLRHCPRLVVCCIGMWESTEDLIVGPQVILPELISLEISTHRNLGNFFNHITLPNLHSIDVMYDPDTPDAHWSLSELPTLLSRSSCSLKRFKILHNTISENVIIGFLQDSMTALVDLCVYNAANDERQRNFCVTDNLLSLLTPRWESDGQTNYLGVHLEAIEIGYGCLSARDGSLSDMVESRWNVMNASSATSASVPRFQRIRVNLPSSHKEDNRRLEGLRAKGLDVDLS